MFLTIRKKSQGCVHVCVCVCAHVWCVCVCVCLFACVCVYVPAIVKSKANPIKFLEKIFRTLRWRLELSKEIWKAFQIVPLSDARDCRRKLKNKHIPGIEEKKNASYSENGDLWSETRFVEKQRQENGGGWGRLSVNYRGKETNKGSLSD